MQTKTTNKLWALALSLIMLLTLLPLSAFTFSTTASAAENSHVFESGTMAAAAAGAYTDGQEVKYDDYFTIYMSSKTKIDSSSKTWADDGYSSAQRLNFGGKGDVAAMKNLLSFKTANPATVKIWFVQGGDDNRQMAIWDASGTQVAVTALTGMTKNEPYYAELKLDAAGTYFLGGETNNNNIYKVEVEEAAAAAQENTFESSTMTAAAAGTYTDGQEVKYDDFFTIYMSSKTKIDSSSKTWTDDGYTSGQRLNFGGKGEVAAMKNIISFKTGAAATVKIWFVQGGDDNRQMAIWDASGTQVAVTALTGMTKNEPYYAELKLDAAGTYFLGGETNNNNIYKVTVISGGGAATVRSDWASVAVPSITSVALNAEDKGKVDVTVSAVIGNDGGDKLSVTMLDKDGKEVDVKNTVVENTKHTVTFAPTASGKYTFVAKLIRDGETDKASTGVDFDFVLPLGTPTISSATSKGDGKIQIIWVPVDEATGYKVYIDGKESGTSAKAEYMASGLTVGKKYSFTVAAVRSGEVGGQSDAVSATATKDSQQTWSFCFYGTSTSKNNNYVEGDLNADGKIKIVSNGGKGKFQESSNDGLAFYYTAIPTTQNFTLRAAVHVDTWTLSSGQEGFGLMAMDSLPDSSSINTTNLFWSNMYRVGAQRLAYWYDSEEGVNLEKLGDKYQMNIGVGVQAKLGMTKDNIDEVYKAAAGTVEFVERTLETAAVEKGLGAGTYSVIGNCTNPETFKNPAVAELTDFIFELQRNNTGYFLSYYTPDGKLVNTEKFYDTDALDQLDSDYVYVGFAAARNMEATVSDVTLTTIDPKDDKPAEEKPKTTVKTNVSIKSASLANSEDYTLMFTSNVKGTAVVSVNGTEAATVDVTTPDAYNYVDVKVTSGSNKVTVKFTPDAKQDLGADKVLDSTAAVTAEVDVKYNTYFAEQNNLYVAPNGTKYGNGGTEYPLDIATAVSVARPGQTIVLMEGTYKIKDGITIERGINGTADAMIYMVADPEAATRPVIDLQEGKSITAVGNYWYFQGFDITNSGDGNPGMYVSGSNCVLDDINSYSNGDCGIYIRSKGNSADPEELWPANNLILNCTAYNNADATGENADGFAAKFTVGEGNVFDGCVSYNNCDDGWDLYARGVSIGAVTLKNCVAYGNGHNTDGSIKGNGNGFKLGGENMPAGHTIINCIAFDNDANGITSNSCPDIKVVNCTSYNNKGSNIALYTGNAALDTAFEASGVISYKGGSADNIAPQGTQKLADLQLASNHYDGSGVTDDWFKSLTFKGSIARNDDGTINMEGFLELTDKAPADTGARMELTESGNVTITPDTDLPNPTTGNAALPVTAAVLALAGAAVFVVSKKRKH